MEKLDKNLSVDDYSSVLTGLRHNQNLSQSEAELLLRDALEEGRVSFNNIGDDKAEIVRRALFEYHNFKKSG